VTGWASSVAAAWALALSVAAAAPAQDRAWPSEGPPRPLAARDVNFPPYEVRTLENGLQVMAVLHHEQPVVSIRMVVRAGSAHDPRGKAGLANLAASLLDQGTTTKSAGQLADEIDFLGGIMGAGAGTDMTFVNVVVMKDSFETGLRLASDMARQPAFAPEEIERQRQLTLSSLRVSFEDPEFVANAVFDRLVYGFHPYGMPQSGTPDTLASITRADLVGYHQKNFVPNNAIIAVVGDLTADEAFNGVRKVFGDWQRREVDRPALIAPPEPTRRVIVVNKPDAVQTEIRVGHLGTRRNNPDFMALNMALRILGGEGANRLHQVLRTERGLTYGAKADLDTLVEAGDFEASTNTRSEATGEVLRLMVDEFWRLQRERVGERELSAARDYLTGSFPLTIETPDAIATQVLSVLSYGLSVEELQNFRQRVNAVRPDDIERVARAYLKPDRLSIVLVGNAAAFSAQLRSLGFGNFETVDMSSVDLMAADFKRSGAPGVGAGGARTVPPAVAPQYVQAGNQAVPMPRGGTMAQTAQVLSRVIEAKGGLERLKALKTLTVTARATGLGDNARQEPVETVTQLAYPNRVRVETRGSRGSVLQVFDGTAAWVRDDRGTREVPERMRSDLETALRRDTIAALLAVERGELRARVLPDMRREQGPPLRAIELSGPRLDPMVLYIDPGNWRIVRQTYAAAGMGSPLVEEAFDDYRTVDGVSIAHKATVHVGGKPVVERRVLDVAVDRPLPPELFRRPS
jgi:zinc protease